MTNKEKILLDYMYEQANNLADFMHRNGYGGNDFRGAGITVSIDYKASGGEIVDLIESGFYVVRDDDVVRSARKTFNPFDGSVGYNEYDYEEEDERGEISEDLPDM